MNGRARPSWRVAASVVIGVLVVACVAWRMGVDAPETGLAWAATPKAPDAKAPSAAPLRWGTYERPFAADSPWNSRPVEPVFDDAVIPKSDYFPAVAEGGWSTGVFLAKATDPPATIRGRPGTPGVWDPDSVENRDVTIPHWPADLAPAIESDGHAEIVDPSLGVIHSFWQLKMVDGQWTAALYAWSALNGRGWGDPAHFYQGARAAAVPSSGGLIRKREIDDGDSAYRHALAMSMAHNGLSANPTYVFPATSADDDAAKANSGSIPEGALLMLPPSFDAQALSTPALRKVAETLKLYGAYAVDRNLGTPFSIYVEIGSGFQLHRRGWNTPAAEDLDRIRQALRRVTGAKQWLDGDGKAFVPEHNLNRLSMRGPWRVQSGPSTGAFDTWKQAVVFGAPATADAAPTVLVNDSGRSLQPVTWSVLPAQASCRITAATSGRGRFRLQLLARTDRKVLFDSGELGDGETRTLAWPADAFAVSYAISGRDGPSSVRANLALAGR